MSSKASDKEIRGRYRGVQEQITSEGLGGVNIAGFDDLRTKTGLPDVSQGKSDPDWVQRKNPEDMPRYITGEGVGYDPGNATVATLEGSTPQRSSGASASQTGLLPRTHELGGHGDPQAFGAVGAETLVGQKQRDRASAGADYLVNREDYGKSTESRVKAGTEGGIQGEELHRGFDVNVERERKKEKGV